MKSITDATWKDAAIIEARSLIARLEDIATKAATGQLPSAPTLNSLTRQAVSVAEAIDHIQEVKRPRRTKGGA